MGSDPLFTFCVNRTVVAGLLVVSLAAGCGSKPAEAPGPSEDALFTDTAHQFLEDMYRRQPTEATRLGIHTYDDRLEGYSKQAITDEVAAARAFRDRIAAIDPKKLSAPNQLDQVQLLHTIDSRLLTLEVVRPWAKDPDTYSSSLTATAYVMIKRTFAPAE